MCCFEMLSNLLFACRDGTIRPGDRIVAVNGFDLSQSSVPEVNDLLIESGGQAMLTVEYDCSVIGELISCQSNVFQ